MKRSPLLAWLYVGFLTLSLSLSFFMATPSPQDDHFHYQKFIETLAHGHLDLSIPGFHGMNMLAVPWFWITQSPLTQIHVQIFSAILLPLLAFLMGRALWRSDWHAVVLSSVMAMMPFFMFGSLRGWMVSTYFVLIFLTIILAARRSRWSWLPWGFAMISLPFAVALLPLMMAYAPASKKRDVWKYVDRYWHLAAALAIPFVYVVAQKIQVGHVVIGAHQDFSATNVWVGPERLFLNAAHGVQMLLSVHNFYFPNPAITGQGNMMHTSPLLIVLALVGFMSWKTFYEHRIFPLVCLLGAVIGIGLNVMIDHMDHFYMDTGVLMLVLASIPVLKRLPLMIPLVLGTLHFQWFYFYLAFGEVFKLGGWFFLTPIVVDACFLLYCFANIPMLKAITREWMRGSTLQP